MYLTSVLGMNHPSRSLMPIKAWFPYDRPVVPITWINLSCILMIKVISVAQVVSHRLGSVSI